MNKQPVERFFDSLTSDYAAAIERCFPRYREMLWALLNYLPANRSFHSILELGCGTGNLSVVLKDAFRTSTIHLVDISGESLEQCQSRLGNDSRLVYQQRDMRELMYDDDAFDLIISSISIHHLTAAEKRDLFLHANRWLVNDGVLTYADQFRGATGALYDQHIANWKQQSLAAGSSVAEFEMWMEHQRVHDHHDTLKDQMDWLGDAGFAVVDCTWRYLLWSVVYACKSRAP